MSGYIGKIRVVRWNIAHIVFLGFRIQGTISQSSESYGIFMQALPSCYYFDLLIGHIGVFKSLSIWGQALGFCRYNSIKNMIGGVCMAASTTIEGILNMQALLNPISYVGIEMKLYFLVRYMFHILMWVGEGVRFGNHSFMSWDMIFRKNFIVSSNNVAIHCY